MKIKTNIALMIPYLTGGGAERVIATLSLNMPENFNVYIITYTDTEHKYPHKGKVININSNESNNVIGKIINTIIRIYKVRKIKKKYNISKTISFLENPNIINILSRYKDKIIVSVRNQKSKEIASSSKRLQKYIIKKVYNKADNVVAISCGVKDDLIDNFGISSKKTSVIYNPVDINYIDSLKSEEIEEEYKSIFKENIIITSGRLTYQKGQWHLIRAFREVKNKIHDAKLVVLGEGELEDELKTLVDELGLKQSVYFLGFKANPFKYIKMSKLFVLPSLFEGFGNVITEAMTCGTVVLSSDCKSGPKEILNPNNIEAKINNVNLAEYGILVPVCSGKMYVANENLSNEEKIMADGIIKCLSDNDLMLKYEEKLSYRINDFRVNKVVEKWCEL